VRDLVRTDFKVPK